MELNVTTDLTVIPKSIEWNFEELKALLPSKLEYYNHLVVTEDGIKAAKADKANLNLLKNAIEDKRKEIKRTCLAPYEVFERQCKEIVGMIQAPISAIDRQIKNFDEQRKQEKYEELKAYYDTVVGDLSEIVAFDTILNPKYGNVSAKLATLKQEISDKIQKCRNDIETLQKQYADKPYLSAIIAKYSESCDLSATLVYATYLREADEKQQAMKQKQAQSEAVQKSFSIPEHVTKSYEQCEVQPDAMQQIREEIAAAQPDPVGSVKFCVTCTRSQLFALRDFMKKTGIQYKVIREEN